MPPLKPFYNAGSSPWLRFALLWLCSCASLPLQAQWWNGLEYTLSERDRMSWEVNGELRTQDELGDVFDRRMGTTFKFKAGSGISLAAGYLLRGKDRAESPVDIDHRLVGGISYPLSNRFLKIEGTTLYERHIGQFQTLAFNRYRQRFEIERTRRGVSPFLYEDLTFKREGFVRSRSRVGLRWRLQGGHGFDLSYQFESIKKGSGWFPRHVIYTEFKIGRPKSVEGIRPSSN